MRKLGVYINDTHKQVFLVINVHHYGIHLNKPSTVYMRRLSHSQLFELVLLFLRIYFLLKDQVFPFDNLSNGCCANTFDSKLLSICCNKRFEHTFPHVAMLLPHFSNELNEPWVSVHLSDMLWCCLLWNKGNDSSSIFLIGIDPIIQAAFLDFKCIKR